MRAEVQRAVDLPCLGPKAHLGTLQALNRGEIMRNRVQLFLEMHQEQEETHRLQQEKVQLEKEENSCKSKYWNKFAQRDCNLCP